MNEPVSEPDDYSPAQLRELALELLGYPTVRGSVARRTVFPPARNLALAMRPSNSEAEVDELQTETSEGLRVLEELGDIDLLAAEEATQAVARAALEGVLSGKELLAVGRLLEVLRRANTSFGSVRSVACRGNPRACRR